MATLSSKFGDTPTEELLEELLRRAKAVSVEENESEDSSGARQVTDVLRRFWKSHTAQRKVSISDERIVELFEQSTKEVFEKSNRRCCRNYAVAAVESAVLSPKFQAKSGTSHDEEGVNMRENASYAISNERIMTDEEQANSANNLTRATNAMDVSSDGDHGNRAMEESLEEEEEETQDEGDEGGKRQPNTRPKPPKAKKRMSDSHSVLSGSKIAISATNFLNGIKFRPGEDDSFPQVNLLLPATSIKIFPEQRAGDTMEKGKMLRKVWKKDKKADVIVLAQLGKIMTILRDKNRLGSQEAFAKDLGMVDEDGKVSAGTIKDLGCCLLFYELFLRFPALVRAKGLCKTALGKVAKNLLEFMRMEGATEKIKQWENGETLEILPEEVWIRPHA